jgi:hypothetical protein
MSQERQSLRNLRLALILPFAIAAMLTMEEPLSATTTGLVCDPMHYGAKADGTTKDTKAVQQAVDTCAAAR